MQIPCILPSQQFKLITALSLLYQMNAALHDAQDGTTTYDRIIKCDGACACAGTLCSNDSLCRVVHQVAIQHSARCSIPQSPGPAQHQPRHLGGIGPCIASEQESCSLSKLQQFGAHQQKRGLSCRICRTCCTERAGPLPFHNMQHE